MHMADPQLTMVELLVRHVLLPRERLPQIEINSSDYRFYISSLGRSAETFAAMIRQHWDIENKLHWSLDVTFNEDRCRIRKDHAAENMVALRHIALNLLRQE